MRRSREPGVCGGMVLRSAVFVRSAMATGYGGSLNAEVSKSVAAGRGAFATERKFITKSRVCAVVCWKI